MLRWLRRRRTPPHGAGFNLIELMIVVAIIALLASIAIIAVLRARMITSEKLAVTSLRAMRQSLEMYLMVYQAYPPDLTNMGAPKVCPPFLQPNMIGDGLTFTRQGYIFIYAPPGGSTYTILANPVTHGTTGERHFLTDNTQAVHFTVQNQDALATDPLVPD